MFYDLLDLAMRDKKISYKALCEELGCSRSNIYSLKKKDNPHLKKMIKQCVRSGLELTISIRNPDTGRVFSETFTEEPEEPEEVEQIQLTNEFMTE